MMIKGSDIQIGMMIKFEYGLEDNWVIAKVINIENNIITFKMYNRFDKTLSKELHQVVIESNDTVQQYEV